MPGDDGSHGEAKIVLHGAGVDDGIGLAAFGRVLASVADALRLEARSLRGEPGRRSGRTSALDEAVTNLRIVRVERGSVQVFVEAPPTDDGELLSGEHVSLVVFQRLITDSSAGALAPEVIDALDRGLSALGDDSSLSCRRGDDRARVGRCRPESRAVGGASRAGSRNASRGSGVAGAPATLRR